MREQSIIGGGVAGLTAAHELIERGFEVSVFERRSTDTRELESLLLLVRSQIEIAISQAEASISMTPV